MLEQARPDLLPAGALLLPLVIIGMFWNRTASGLFFGGLLLIIDWVIRPHGLPLIPVAVTFGATMLLASAGSRDTWTGSRRRWRIPEWMHPVLLVGTGIALLVGPGIAAQQITPAALGPILARYALVSLPFCLLLTGLMKVAGEFGWRRLV